MRSRVESMLESDSPYDNESGKLIIKFFAKLTISPYVLLEWTSSNSQVFLKSQEALMAYITDRWTLPVEVAP